MVDKSRLRCLCAWIKGQGVSIVISFAALIVSIVSFAQTLNQEAKHKQLEAVAEITEYIHETPININYQGIRCTATLFEIPVLFSDEIPDSSQIIFRYEEPYPVDFRKYAKSPFVPEDIADILVDYWSYDIIILTEQSIKNYSSLVLMSNFPNIEHQVATQGFYPGENDSWIKYQGFKGAQAYRSWADFVDHCEKLKEALRRWLRKKGVGDINIRDDDLMYL